MQYHNIIYLVNVTDTQLNSSMICSNTIFSILCISVNATVIICINHYIREDEFTILINIHSLTII